MNTKDVFMIHTQFGGKFLITWVTLFALNAFALNSAPADVNKADRSASIVLSVRGGKKNGLGQSDSFLILDNSQRNNLKNFQRFLTTRGPRTGGGGNSCALSIHQNTEKLVSLLYEMPNLLSESERKKLLSKISVAKFYLTESLSLDGQLKDAINYPDTNEIFISYKLCGLDLLEVQSRAMAILLHEYLGLAKTDDRQYQISGAFLQNYAAYYGRGYTFTANNSYYAETGECIQSVLQIQQIGNNFIVSSSANPGSRILALSRKQVEAFRSLGDRDWGSVKTAKIKDKALGDEYVFSGESCGRMKCDSLTIRHADGKSERFENSIHGLGSISCKH